MAVRSQPVQYLNTSFLQDRMTSMERMESFQDRTGYAVDLEPLVLWMLVGIAATFVAVALAL